jgi:hypothetical protein
VKRVVALSAMNVDDDLDEQPSRYRGDRNKEVEDTDVVPTGAQTPDAGNCRCGSSSRSYERMQATC